MIPNQIKKREITLEVGITIEDLKAIFESPEINLKFKEVIESDKIAKLVAKAASIIRNAESCDEALCTDITISNIMGGILFNALGIMAKENVTRNEAVISSISEEEVKRILENEIIPSFEQIVDDILFASDIIFKIAEHFIESLEDEDIDE